MFNIQERNKKIIHLIVATVSDLCKLYNAAYEKNDESIIVYTEQQEPWFYTYPIFNDNNFEIVIKAFVHYNLSVSQATKLREIYKANNIAEFLNDNEMTMMFHKDRQLLTAYSFKWDYKNYALLKSKLIIEIYTQLQNVSEIRIALDESLEEMKSIGAN